MNRNWIGSILLSCMRDRTRLSEGTHSYKRIITIWLIIIVQMEKEEIYSRWIKLSLKGIMLLIMEVELEIMKYFCSV
jgi:hypothetical protein